MAAASPNAALDDRIIDRETTPAASWSAVTRPEPIDVPAIARVDAPGLAVGRAAFTFACAALSDERATTRRADAQPEARQLVVPDDVAPVPESGVRDGAGREAGLLPANLTNFLLRTRICSL